MPEYQQFEGQGLQRQVHQADGGHGFHDDRSAEGKADVVAAANSGFGYAGGGFEGHAEHYWIAVCYAAVHPAGVVCNGRLGPVMTAAAVVLLAVIMMAVMAFLMFSVAALVIWVVMMAMVTFFVLSVATFMLREEVYVLRSLHSCGLKAVSELNAADAGNCKHGVG